MKHALLLILLFAAFAFLIYDRVPGWPYGYDEADYMWASSLGLRSNYTDSPTLPFPEFLRLGMASGRHGGAKETLSEVVRSRNDIVFYRHWHGTLYFYWLLATAPLHQNEQLMRGLQLLFPAAGALLIYFGVLRIVPAGVAVAAATLSTFLYLWSEPVVGSLEIAPHQLFAVCCLATLFLLACSLLTGSRSYWYAAVVCSALAFCTLEVAFALLITVAVCCWIGRRELNANLPFIAKSVGLFAATVLVVWPGALLKLSVVKAYLFMAYLAVFRTQAWGTTSTVTQVWELRILHSPVDWALVAIAAGGYMFVHRHVRRALLPFIVFSVLMIAAVFRVNGDSPRYALPFMPALDVFAGITVTSILARRSPLFAFIGVAALCLALVNLRLNLVLAHPLGTGADLDAVLSCVRQDDLAERRLLVSQEYLPTVHYYFPRTSLTGYRDETSWETERRRSDFAAIIGPGQPPACQISQRAQP